ncbi:uncharacterized protein BXIN_0352 [Babesia sp. Xinjiang]|uniref:uncharacterized protein n=1 Tax=Babesia sp. Xinjiang TaxID=462227 RepID=UPI000A248434|nr:uncharacterized protein BXIN_0352 [Babesia sp. Xinjiang]ORM41190.1 hypothetical protein BXIN_0352 [Babesia sp. Xinjiang]
MAFVQIIAVDDVLGADLTQQKELKGRMPTPPGFDELTDQRRDTLPDDGDFEDQELCVEGDEGASSEEEAEEIEPASHSKPSAVSMEIEIGEAYKPPKSCFSRGEIKIDDSAMELAKERFKRILRRLTEFHSEQVLYKPYVKMVQGMKNRRSIILPIDIAQKLANLKPGQLPEPLAWDLGRYLSRVLLKEHIEELAEPYRSRKESTIRSDLWNYVFKALTWPWALRIE